MNLIKKFEKFMFDKQDNEVGGSDDLGNDFSKKSYSQSGEDLIINNIFLLRDIVKPSYVDIGAHHPWLINNTALLYNKGSRGINIEPNPELLTKFEKERPEDINLNIGISSQGEAMDFYIIKDNTFSTFSEEESIKFVSHGHEIEKIIKVKTSKIKETIKDYAGGIFPDLLSIDVEGLEMEILKDIDYVDNYPKIICVETADYSPIGAGIKRVDIMNFIESKGYYLYADTNLNSIFVKNEFWFIGKNDK
jgi:FkbM family methyltransferase